MSQSYPFTATNNIIYDPTYYNTINHHELSISACEPSLAKVQPELDTAKDHTQVDANNSCQEELLDEWVLVKSKPQAKEISIDEGKQPLQHFP